MTSLLSLERVSVVFSGHRVLDDVSLSVLSGKIVTVVGPNGAGKSTLLKAALGLIPLAGGRVERRAGRVGYVPQTLQVERILPLSARRFLAMAAPGGRREGLEHALDQVGAGHVLNRQVADLSGGELQRVLLARALLRRPDLLVLDEPVGGVDMTGQAELYDLIAALAHDGAGMGILMVSHDLHVVMAATDEVICLNRHVCCAGHPEAVSRHPEYLALFGPRAAGSLAIYAHNHDHGHLPDGSVRPLPDGHIHGPDCHHG